MPSAAHAIPVESAVAVPCAQTAQVHLGGLANEVLRAIGTRASLAQPPIRATSLQTLVQQILDPAAFDAPGAVETLLADGATHHEIADRYVPAAARGLGECWLADDLGFARVTVASGRLQEMLGHLVQSNDVQQAWDRSTPRVTLLSLRGDQHSLGWKLVTLQLRRQGVSVDALPCVTAEEGADLIEVTRADLVMVSVSKLSLVGIVADIASILRARLAAVPPIVLGGLVVERLDQNMHFPDVVCITNDLGVALSHRIRETAPGRSRFG